MPTQDTSQPLWEASAQRKARSQMQAFLSFVAPHCREAKPPQNWSALYEWSCRQAPLFWQLCSEFVGTQWHTPPRATWQAPPQAGVLRGGHWFVEGRFNFAQNCLPAPSAANVLVACYEGGARVALSGQELWQKVASCQASLEAMGVGQGDYVAGVLHNGWEAIVAMLATAALGAVWTSCSPDFGAGGILDRLGQLKPKVVFASLGYRYNGKYFACDKLLAELERGLGAASQWVGVSYPGHEASAVDEAPAGRRTFASCLATLTSGKPHFVSTAFEHPLFVLFSSGTTGRPKAIVHGAGGTWLQHQKELRLHSDLQAGERFLFYTTCGWMMWNWMASALPTGATLLTYDGSPAYPHTSALWELAARESISVLGTSPKYIGACLGKGDKPGRQFDLHALKTILTTGSPLLPEHFLWVYDAVQADVHLASISGGTDIISCFMLGNPLLPVYAGQIQGPGLGMAIAAFDEAGRPVSERKGELVCTQAFVSMPLGFLHDPDGSRYEQAYFTRYDGGPEVWRHGDYVEFTAQGGVIVYGRSDATLNPGGVRIGTSELYRQVETLPEIEDSLAVGRQVAGDCEVVLFVKLRAGGQLDAGLVQKIKTTIRAGLTVRHVPTHILAVNDIPYTRSGKKVELAVTRLLHGEAVDNSTALANPESLDEYRSLKFPTPSAR